MTITNTWYDDPYFDSPDRPSVDGGTTTRGPLWHSVSPRWGHSMHPMCSYHGMFPAKLAHYFIHTYSRPGDLVLDPFSGRGTVPLQALAEGRRSISNDLSPLAYVLSRAKTNPPPWRQVMTTLDGIERAYSKSGKKAALDVPPDIRMLFHDNTLRQLEFIRKGLLRRPLSDWSRTDLMLAGAAAGILHGAHRRDGTSRYLSISMPNTFSMSPAYVRKFIREKKLTKPDQDVFECLREKLARLYLDSIEGTPGKTYRSDACDLLRARRIRGGSVDLVVTSPPYLKVVNYGTANWIRLWWLGIDEVGRQQGAGRKTLDAALDHQHTYRSYESFFTQILTGIRRVLRRDGVAVIVVGDVAQPGGDPLPLAQQIWSDVGPDTGLRLLDLIEDNLAAQNKVSRIWGDTKGNATDRDCVLVLAREDGDPQPVTTAIDWDEPYKEGGPDEAHRLLKEYRKAS